VRYTLVWPPLDLVTCSCRHCQKQSGGALSVVAVVGQSMLSIEGSLTTYIDVGNSGQDVLRRFCATCGSPILTDTPSANGAGLRFVKVGTLDDTTDLKPRAHYWTERAQGWVLFPSDDHVALREEAAASGDEDHQRRQ
jgi:hypothetical protein